MISIIIPAYNEEEAIGADLELILKTMDASTYCDDYEIIVVDDGARDGTAEIVQQYASVRLVQHGRNRGVGAARTTGIKHARGDIIVMTDGDGTYPNQDIPRLLDEMGDAHMIIGARRQEKGTLHHLRKGAKWFIRSLASFLTNAHIPDLNSGLRAFRKDVAVRFLPLLPTGHSWVSTITIAFLSDGYTVHFTPIDYYKRKGTSTFHPIADTYNYISLVVRTIMYFNPLKIFLPMATILAIVSSIKIVRDLFFAYNDRLFYFPANTVMLVLTTLQIGAIGLLADLIVKRSNLTTFPPGDVNDAVDKDE